MVPLLVVASRIQWLGMGRTLVSLGLWSRKRPIFIRMVRSEGLPNLTLLR